MRLRPGNCRAFGVDQAWSSIAHAGMVAGLHFDFALYAADTGASRRHAPSRPDRSGSDRQPPWCGRFGQIFVKGVVEDGVMRIGHHMRQEQHRIGHQGWASRWKAWVMNCTAICAATSPCRCPPMPSAMTISRASRE